MKSIVQQVEEARKGYNELFKKDNLQKRLEKAREKVAALEEEIAGGFELALNRLKDRYPDLQDADWDYIKNNRTVRKIGSSSLEKKQVIWFVLNGCRGDFNDVDTLKKLQDKTDVLGVTIPARAGLVPNVLLDSHFGGSAKGFDGYTSLHCEKIFSYLDSGKSGLTKEQKAQAEERFEAFLEANFGPGVEH